MGKIVQLKNVSKGVSLYSIQTPMYVNCYELSLSLGKDSSWNLRPMNKMKHVTWMVGSDETPTDHLLHGRQTNFVGRKCQQRTITQGNDCRQLASPMQNDKNLEGMMSDTWMNLEISAPPPVDAATRLEDLEFQAVCSSHHSYVSESER